MQAMTIPEGQIQPQMLCSKHQTQISQIPIKNISGTLSMSIQVAPKRANHRDTTCL